VPIKDGAVEQVPFRARADSRAGLRTHLQESLAHQDLNRLAQGVAADAEFGNQLGLGRQNPLCTELAADDPSPELIDNLIV